MWLLAHWTHVAKTWNHLHLKLLSSARGSLKIFQDGNYNLHTWSREELDSILEMVDISSEARISCPSLTSWKQLVGQRQLPCKNQFRNVKLYFFFFVWFIGGLLPSGIQLKVYYHQPLCVHQKHQNNNSGFKVKDNCNVKECLWGQTAVPLGMVDPVNIKGPIEIH